MKSTWTGYVLSASLICVVCFVLLIVVFVVVAPDSFSLLYSGVRGRSVIEESDIFLRDSERHWSINLTQHAGMDFSPVWSPNGRQFAFISDRTGKNGVYIMEWDYQEEPSNLYGGELPAGQAFLHWSPDGTKIAISHCNRQERMLTVVDLTTHVMSTIARDVQCNSLDWSPDSRRITFVKAVSTDRYAIFIAEVADGGLMMLPERIGLVYSPQWDRDSIHVLFLFLSPDRPASTILRRVNTITGQIDDAAQFQNQRVWRMAASPDRKHLALLSLSNTIAYLHLYDLTTSKLSLGVLITDAGFETNSFLDWRWSQNARYITTTIYNLNVDPFILVYDLHTASMWSLAYAAEPSILP